MGQHHQLDGAVSGIIPDISDSLTWEKLETATSVHRLFDYIVEDRTPFAETDMYTPTHLLVMSKKLDRENPSLAKSIYSSSEEAKQVAYRDILDDRAGFSVVYLRERFIEPTAQWGDPWKYGVAANESTVETFSRYNATRGITSRQLSVDELFAKSLLSTDFVEALEGFSNDKPDAIKTEPH